MNEIWWEGLTYLVAYETESNTNRQSEIVQYTKAIPNGCILLKLISGERQNVSVIVLL